MNPDTGEPYNRDPRSIAKKALTYVQSSGVGDTVYFGPEAEFFIFDDVRWSTAAARHRLRLRLHRAAGQHRRKEYPEGNMGHRPGPKGGYFPVNPVDSGQDLRGEMLAVMGELGMKPEKHHHEVAPAQHELGLKFADLMTMADRLQLYKYVIHNVAAAYGKTATFMAKPMFGDNGSGMHVHQSIWKDGKPHVRRRQVRRPVGTCASGTSAASSSTPRPSTPSRTRPPTPTSAWCPATKRR